MSPTLRTPQGDGNLHGRYSCWAVGCQQTSPTLLTPQGDGNRIAAGLTQQELAMSPTLLTPQGDGNLNCKPRELCLPPSPGVPHPPYPARGRKLWYSFILPAPSSMSPTLLTPQGDGNTISKCSLIATIDVPHPPYPARGRKRNIVKTKITMSSKVPHPPYPARGRKLLRCNY